jgi:hypothetical protein
MNRRTFITQCTMATVGLTTVWQGCQPVDTRSTITSDARGQGAFTPAEGSSLEPPAIDLAAPPVFETATFAMG